MDIYTTCISSYALSYSASFAIILYKILKISSTVSDSFIKQRICHTELGGIHCILRR